MSTDISTIDTTQQELEELIAKLTRGEHNEVAARKSCQRMDLLREETRRRIGTVEVAVDLIRELRDR